MLLCDLTLPLRTVSEMNVRTHWAVRAKRMKEHRFVAFGAIAGAAAPFGWVFPLRIVLTRYSAGKLDDDNLRSALKGVRDGVADAMGLADNNPNITFEYEQERCERKCYAVGIKVYQCDA